MLPFVLEKEVPSAIPSCGLNRNKQPVEITNPCQDENAVCITVDNQAYQGTCFCSPDFQYEYSTRTCNKGIVFVSAALYYK